MEREKERERLEMFALVVVRRPASVVVFRPARAGSIVYCGLWQSITFSSAILYNGGYPTALSHKFE